MPVNFWPSKGAEGGGAFSVVRCRVRGCWLRLFGGMGGGAVGHPQQNSVHARHHNQCAPGSQRMVLVATCS